MMGVAANTNGTVLYCGQAATVCNVAAPIRANPSKPRRRRQSSCSRYVTTTMSVQDETCNLLGSRGLTENNLVHNNYQYSTYTVPVADRAQYTGHRAAKEIVEGKSRTVSTKYEVIVDYHQQRVTVTGNAAQAKILKEIQKVKSRATMYIRK